MLHDLLDNSSCTSQPVSVAVLRETDGDGVGRILEASGNADLLNNCFKLLRYDVYFLYLR